MVFPGFRGESYAMLRAIKEEVEGKGNKCLREGLHRIIEVMGGRYCKQYQTQEMRYQYSVFANQKTLSEQHSRITIAM
jgi:hypothetical protein